MFGICLLSKRYVGPLNQISGFPFLLQFSFTEGNVFKKNYIQEFLVKTGTNLRRLHSVLSYSVSPAAHCHVCIAT